MDRKTFWKNFSLGKELSIAGSFIFNGLKAFDSMEYFADGDEIFEFFYNTSVGLERLLKIVVILIEHTDAADQEDFENSLRTHNHAELLKRILKKHNCNLSKQHKEFIEILNKFYKTMRYDRYNLNSIESPNKEKVILINYIEKHLKVKIENSFDIFPRSNEFRFKKFIGKVVGKISEELYRLVVFEARRLNIYTYEMYSNSKASIIFQHKKYNSYDFDIVWKELLIYLINTSDDSGTIDFIRSIEPLDFNPELINEYLTLFKSDSEKLRHMIDIQSQYNSIDDKGDRFDMLELLGDPGVRINNEEEEDLDEEEI